LVRSFPPFQEKRRVESVPYYVSCSYELLGSRLPYFRASSFFFPPGLNLECSCRRSASAHHSDSLPPPYSKKSADGKDGIFLMIRGTRSEPVPPVKDGPLWTLRLSFCFIEPITWAHPRACSILLNGGCLPPASQPLQRFGAAHVFSFLATSEKIGLLPPQTKKTKNKKPPPPPTKFGLLPHADEIGNMFSIASSPFYKALAPTRRVFFPDFRRSERGGSSHPLPLLIERLPRISEVSYTRPASS